jgi:hypothetical protein
MSGSQSPTTGQFRPGLWLSHCGHLLIAVCISLGSADVLVNDDTHGGIPQLSPDIAFLADGRFIIAWEDYRSADYDADIYCQVYDSLGQAVDTNYVVSQDSASRDIWSYRQTQPALARSRSDRAVVCWQDQRRGYSHVYFARLDECGRPLGDNQAIVPVYPSPGPETLAKTQPDIAAIDTGYVLVWTQQLDSTGRTTVWGAIIDQAGRPLNSFRVADNKKSDWCWNPTVAGADSGFVVAWEQTGSEQVVRRRWFERSGSPRGTSVKLPFPGAVHPRVACDPGGNGLLVWQNAWAPRIWGQTFGDTGQTPGPMFTVNDDVASHAGSPCVTTGIADDRFLVAWEDGRGSEVQIYAQFVDRYGTLLGRNLRLDSAPRPARQGLPAIALRNDSRLAAAWVDTREGDQNIYGGCRGPAVRSFRVNSDMASALQDYPVITQDSLGNCTVFWFDFRNNQSAPDIYAQRFDHNLQRLGANFQVNDAPPGRAATFFWAATNRSGQTIVAWEDARGGNPDIYAQLYRPDGTALGANFIINDNAGNSDQGWPSAAINDSGATVAAWTDTRNGGVAVFAQNFDRIGRRYGNNWLVDADGREATLWLGNQGDFWVAWRASTGIKARHFRAPQQPLCPEVVITDTSGQSIAAPRIAVTRAGEVWLVWMDDRRGEWEVYAQRVSPAGERIGGNFRVNDDNVICQHFLPNISTDPQGRVYVTWSDFRMAGNLDVRGQVFDGNGARLDTNFFVNTEPFPPAEQWAYGSVSAGGPRVVYAWLDNRNRRSWDVYARAADDTAARHLDRRSLFITPSPVSHTCRVRPALALTGPATLSVYSTLGRRVRRLSLPDAASPIIVDCRELPSGVYCARLAAAGQVFTGRFAVRH